MATAAGVAGGMMLGSALSNAFGGAAGEAGKGLFGGGDAAQANAGGQDAADLSPFGKVVTTPATMPACRTPPMIRPKISAAISVAMAAATGPDCAHDLIGRPLLERALSLEAPKCGEG